MGTIVIDKLSTNYSEYSIVDFFNDNQTGAFASFLVCMLVGVSAGYLLMDLLLIPLHIIPIEETEETKRIRDYEIGYLDELSALEDTDPDQAALDVATVVDDTPFGKVIMSYSVSNEAFWYYADTKTVPYKTLDALARQFAVKHACKRICVNYKEEWENAKARAIAEQDAEDSKIAADADKKDIDDDSNKPNTQLKTRNVFAKLKKYNTLDAKPSPSKSQETTSKIRKDSIKRRRYRITNERANRFTHKGRLDDYVDTNIVDTNIVKCEPSSVMSFADFKAMQKKTV